MAWGRCSTGNRRIAVAGLWRADGPRCGILRRRTGPGLSFLLTPGIGADPRQRIDPVVPENTLRDGLEDP